ncbi:sulfatase family protein [Halobacillus faecis]
MNIVYIHTHDTGKQIKPYGKNVPTPHLMAFAQESLLFSNAFNGSPTCSPSRASFMTGTYPHQNGMLGLAHRGFQLVDLNWHLAKFLQSQQYETVLSGVQHEHRFWNPLDKGDEAAEELGYTTHLTSDMKGYDESSSLAEWDQDNAKRIVEYIRERENKAQPFFLSYGLFTTHREYPELTEKEREGKYNPNYVEVPSGTYPNKQARVDAARFNKSAHIADTCFGMVMDALKEVGLYEDTLVMFSTDHGVANPFMKGSLTDQGIGVPLLIRHPRYPETFGRVTDELVSQIDVFPTVCDLLSLPKPDHLQGISFIDILGNPKNKTREFVFAETNFHTSYEPARCVRTTRYKYIKYFDDLWPKYNLSNTDESELKELLIEHGWTDKVKDEEYLFDLYFDPSEGKNLVKDEQYQDVLNKLREELQHWQMETEDPLLEGAYKFSASWKVNKRSSLRPSSNNIEDYDQWPCK